MASKGAIARKHLAWRRPRHLHRQCFGKRALPSRAVAKSIATRLGIDWYRCDLCHSWHVGSRKRAASEAPRFAIDGTMAPVMTARPGETGEWDAHRILRIVSVFVHHHGREPVRIHFRRGDGCMSLW